MTSDITVTQSFKIHYFVLKSSFLLCCNLKKPIKKKISSQTERTEFGCLSSLKHTRCSSPQIRKLGICLFFFNKYFATKCYLSKMALAVSFRLIYETIPFRKLLFSIALIVNC